MAEGQGQDDKTEDATPEKREEAKEQGQAVLSRELTSVAVLAATCAFSTMMAPALLRNLVRLFTTHFEAIATRRIDRANFLDFIGQTWLDAMWVVLPIFGVTLIVSVALTFGQTRILWSWERLTPDFSRLDPLQGLKKMMNSQALMELFKGIAKMLAVTFVSYLILKSEWRKVPELMNYSIQSTWAYWGGITKSLFWSVSMLLLVIGGADYLFNFLTFERSLKMSKQEVKEEYKRREVDPQIKARLRRMSRDILSRKALTKTREATVILTNPTHYSVALKYEPGMKAPIVVAKGIDFLALQMREVAKELKIPIIENRPLARELYASVKEGQEIPDKLYKVVAEIIRYVFKLKGKMTIKKAN